MDAVFEYNRKTGIKWAKVYRTVCEMARDRGNHINTLNTSDIFPYIFSRILIINLK